MCSGLGFFTNLAFRASKNRFITIVLVYLSPRAKRAKVQRRRCHEGNTDHTQDILPDGVVIEILAEIIRSNQGTAEDLRLLPVRAWRRNLLSGAQPLIHLSQVGYDGHSSVDIAISGQAARFHARR